MYGVCALYILFSPLLIRLGAFLHHMYWEAATGISPSNAHRHTVNVGNWAVYKGLPNRNPDIQSPYGKIIHYRIALAKLFAYL